jgi:hypothetical protein
LLTVTANSVTGTYGAVLPAFTYTVGGFVNSDTASTAVTGSPTFTTTVPAGNPAGTYQVTPALGTLAAANYTFQFASGALTIQKAQLTFAASPATSVYGSALPTFGFGVTGFVNGDTAGTAYSGAPSLTTTAAAGSSVGSYPISITAGSLVSSNYSFLFTPGTFAITKAVLTVTANNLSSTYGSAVPALTYAVSGYVGTDTAATAYTGAPALTTAVSVKTSVGSYPITVGTGSLASANYSFQFVPGTLTVAQAVLVVQPGNTTSTHGAALPAFTYTLKGFLNGDTTASATKGTASLSTTATSDSPAGTYPINASLGTLTATNYTFQFATGTLTMKIAYLTITANPATSVFGTTPTGFTFTVAGLLDGDTAGTAFTGTPSLTTVATPKSPVGTYTITAALGTLASSSYGFHFANGTVTVTPPALLMALPCPVLRTPSRASPIRIPKHLSPRARRALRPRPRSSLQLAPIR